jgi:site-specific recombinase XerD
LLSRPNLALVGNTVETPTSSFKQKLADHDAILQDYIDTFLLRNLSDTSIKAVSRFLRGWFEGLIIPDPSHPNGERQMLVWEAMAPVLGRQHVMAFTKGLVCSGLKSTTIGSYLGYLRRFFQYVLEFPYIPGNVVQYISTKYNRIEQPVSEYDYPTHVVDDEPEGYALSLQELVDFYDFIRTVYIPGSQKKFAAARDYSMIVMAGETGLRADELKNLDVEGKHIDLFYEKGRVQTRFGKGTKGSGKRTRKTVFSPLAQATTLYYVESIRPKFINAEKTTALYISERGIRISYSTMWRNLTLIVEEARKEGLALPPKLSWHDLRRSFATNFMEMYPNNSWLLLDMLGHRNPSTLNRYVKHRRAFYDKAVDRVLDDLLANVVKAGD